MTADQQIDWHEDRTERRTSSSAAGPLAEPVGGETDAQEYDGACEGDDADPVEVADLKVVLALVKECKRASLQLAAA